MLRTRAVSVGAAVLLCLPAVGALAAEAPCAPAGVPVLAKGGFVFFSNAVLQKPADAAGTAQRTERLEWIKRFRVCLTNGYGNFAGRDLDELHAAGCELFDYDASESIATSYAWGKEAEIQLEGKGPQKVRDTFYRSWDGTEGLKESGRDRVAKVAGRPRVRVCDINYLQPWYVPTGGTVEAGGRHVPVFTLRTDRPAIFYSFVASTLLGGDVCASDWYAEGYGRDDVYFLDLGTTLGPSYAETQDAVARYFANGLVVLTRSNGRVVFRPDPTCLPADLAGLWDAYEGTRVHDWQGQRAVTIHPAYYPSTQSYYPSGRVYLYLR